MEEKPILNIYLKYIEEGKFVRATINEEYTLDYAYEKPVLYEGNISLRKKDQKKQGENLEAIINIVKQRGHEVIKKNFYNKEINVVEEGLKACVFNFVNSNESTFKSQFYENENGELKGNLYAKFDCSEDPPVSKDRFAEALVIWNGSGGYEVTVKGWPDELDGLEWAALHEMVDRYACVINAENHLKVCRYEYIRLFCLKDSKHIWHMNPPMKGAIISPKEIDAIKFNWQTSHVNGCKVLYPRGTRPKLIGTAHRGSLGISNPFENNWKFHPLTQALAYQKLKELTPERGTAWVLLEAKSSDVVEAHTLFVIGDCTTDMQRAEHYSWLLEKYERNLTLEDKNWLNQWMWKYAPRKFFDDRINHEAFKNIALSPLVSNTSNPKPEEDEERNQTT